MATFYSKIRKHTLVTPGRRIQFQPNDLVLDLPDGEKRVYPRGIYQTNDAKEIKTIKECSDFGVLITEEDPYAKIVKKTRAAESGKEE